MLDPPPTTDLYLGADPGATGAFALISGNRVTVFDVPTLARPIGGTVVDDDALLALASVFAGLGVRRTVLEHTWGVRGQGGASQYKFGDTAAAMRLALKSAGLRVDMVAAIRWTTALRVGSDKDRHVAEAIRLFPDDARHFTPRRGVLTYEQCKGRADATLIALWGRKTGAC